MLAVEHTAGVMYCSSQRDWDLSRGHAQAPAAHSGHRPAGDANRHIGENPHGTVKTRSPHRPIPPDSRPTSPRLPVGVPLEIEFDYRTQATHAPATAVGAAEGRRAHSAW